MSLIHTVSLIVHVQNYLNIVHIISWKVLNALLILNQNEQFGEIYKKVIVKHNFAGRSALHVPKLSSQTFLQYCQWFKSYTTAP